SKEILGSTIAVGAVAFAILYAVGQLPAMEFIPWFLEAYMAPIVVGMGIFAGVLLEPGLAALGAFGKDGKAIWIIKNSPANPREIVKAKALGSLYTAPILGVGAGFIPVVWVGYSISTGVFAAIMAISMSLFAVGIGIWLGARAPNFDPSMKGYPDVVTIYMYSMLCLVVCLVSTMAPFLLMFQSWVLGILAAILVADVGALFLYLGIEVGAMELEKLETP
ncbi:MAG: hypothetical protein QCI38_08900, partial [Candidatus Thermoplasmatota archaeon]|nr:hypothetical protein [Candidatus Thermoplasmatota archaeon]